MANWWDKNLTDKQKFRLQEPKDPSLLDVVSTVPNPVGDIASGLLAAQDVSKGNYGSAALNALGLLPFVPSMGASIKNVGKEINAYPLAPAGTRYQEYSGNLTYMTPDEYLRNVRPLTLDESSLDNIADLKRHIESGGKLDPLAIYPNGKEDGRHRAYLAKELGITQVPVALHGRTKYEIQQATAQKNATLPVAEGGLGLPASNTAMDRAKALGFDTSAYHGTNADIANFSNDKLGYATKAKSANMAHWSTNRPDVASSYANYAALDAPVSRLLADADKMESLGKWDKYDELITKAEELESSNQANNLLGQNVLPLMIKKGKSNNMTAMSENWTGAEKNINSELKNAKLSKKDSLVIHNLDDDPFFANRDATHYAIFNPSNIRSRFAAFDPFRRNEADILAGVAPLAVGSLLGLNTYNNMQEKPKKDKKKTK
jgi:hypothetical protein